MPTEIFHSNRRFQIWKYTVGHSQLLLRSTKCAESPTRVDVFFKGVREIHLPTVFAGLAMAEADAADIEDLCILRRHLPATDGTKAFRIQGADFVGYVLAIVVAYHEDEGEYDDPSHFAKDNLI